MTRPSWDRYALALARVAATRSEDPFRPVGCVILRADHSVASLGYNGAPSGVEIDWSDRDARRPLVIHAETNALRWVRPGEGVLLATTTKPCSNCITQARANGITEIVYHEDFWDDSEPVAEALGVTLRQLPAPAVIDVQHLLRQRRWSEETFGPGPRTKGVLDHIRKELVEIEEDPLGTEWVDLIILAFDGIWRAGYDPQQILDAIVAKQGRNEARTWPDWRAFTADTAIEHVRSVPEPEAPPV
jgi:deoxycytidylate deaminase